MSVVLKVKQLQNLVRDESKAKMWEQKRLEQLEERERAILEGQIDIGGHDQNNVIMKERELARQEEDWRGYFLPSDLSKSVLFTRGQLR